MTPLAVWKSATRLRRAVGDELAFLMDVRGLYKVTANGVSMKVGAGTLHYGAKSQALKRYVGRKVLVALDPDDVSHCWAFTPDRQKRQLIGRLDSNESIAPYTSADDAREAIAEIKREQSVMHKARRAQARRTLRMAERMREHSQAKRAELMRTGTDDIDVQPTIVPVRTGFEGVSKPARSTFETTCRPWDDGDVSDLFDDTPSEAVVDDDEGMEDLFGDDPGEDSDDGLDGLL